MPEYKGSMFRGAFGWAFRRAVCVTQKPDCTGCILQKVCSYYKVFETEVPEGMTVPFLAGVKKMPHPYILTPPLDNGRNYPEGAELTLGLSLFGDTAKMLPFFIYSFQQMGQAGIGYARKKFRLMQVMLIGEDDNKTELFNDIYRSLADEVAPVLVGAPTEEPAPPKVTLRFLTPWRAQENARILTRAEEVTPELLINAASRRFLVMESLYGQMPPPEEPPDCSGITISENKLRFADWERYSNRQQTKMSMGGFMGEITLEGNLAPVWKWLKAGEYIHIGKNAAFGLGKYEIKTD